MQKTGAFGRAIVASVVIVATSMMLGVPVQAGAHSAYVKTIDERATKLGCSMIDTNRNFTMMTGGLKLAGYTPIEFFLNASCEAVITHIRRDELSPIKFAIADPSSRRVMVEHFLRYLDELKSPELTKIILNELNDGRTTLDYLDYMYHESFSRDPSAQRDLDALRREFCKRGGVYQSRLVSY